MTHPDAILKEKPITKPPRRYRNRYSTLVQFQFPNGRVVGPGDYYGGDIWPSYEVSEQKGVEWIRRHGEYVIALGIVYRGPVEEGE